MTDIESEIAELPPTDATCKDEACHYCLLAYRARLSLLTKYVGLWLEAWDSWDMDDDESTHRTNAAAASLRLIHKAML